MKCCFLLENQVFSWLGPEYLLSVLLNSGYQVDVVYDDVLAHTWEEGVTTGETKSVIDKIIDTNCDVVFTSVNAKNYIRHYGILRDLKAKKKNIINCFGGPQATNAFFHIIRQDAVDFLCRGEGEIAILEFLDFLQGKSTTLPNGIYHNKEGEILGSGMGKLLMNLDLLPYPDKSHFLNKFPRGKDIYSIMSGRGCFNKCTFCNSSNTFNDYRSGGDIFLRRRSVNDLVTELKIAKEHFNPKYIMFVDDTFIYNKQYMEKFADMYKAEIAIPFGCSTIPNFFHEDTLDRLVEAGLVNVEVGIQSLNENLRKNIFGRNETNEQYEKFVGMLRKRNVYVNTDQIINPWDSSASLKGQILRYNKIKPSYINVFNLQYLPGTGIIDHAIRDGFLREEDRDAINAASFGCSTLDVRLEKKYPELKGLILLIALSPFLPSSLMRHLLNDKILRFIKLIPGSFILIVRAISAIFQKGDALGRHHIHTVWVTLLGISAKPDKRLVEFLKKMPFIKHEVFPPTGWFAVSKEKISQTVTKREG